MGRRWFLGRVAAALAALVVPVKAAHAVDASPYEALARYYAGVDFSAAVPRFFPGSPSVGITEAEASYATLVFIPDDGCPRGRLERLSVVSEPELERLLREPSAPRLGGSTGRR